ncbi:MAG: NAD(+) synthase [bacterium]
MNTQAALSPGVLQLDAAAEIARIAEMIRVQTLTTLRRKGVVVAISGGIDSSVVAAISALALGPERVLGLLLPEADSSPDSTRLGRALAESLGIRTCIEDISPVLEAAGCYRRRDAAIRKLLPEYGEGWKCKIVLPNLLEGKQYSLFSVVVRSPDGRTLKARLDAEAYFAIVAATSFKQRTRKMMEYYYADLMNYAVAGTPNRLEYDQGFFVKNGDGAADLKPIAHLYKTQVYQLAEHLRIPAEIVNRPPTTDTYPLDQSQEEFYFAVPYQAMDLCLFGKNNGVPAEHVAPAANLTVEQVERVYGLIDSKRAAARYLHAPPLMLEPQAAA